MMLVNVWKEPGMVVISWLVSAKLMSEEEKEEEKEEGKGKKKEESRVGSIQ